MDKLLDALDRFIEATRRVSKQRALAPLEAQCTKALQKAFRRQGRAMARRLETLRDKWPIQEADMPAGWDDWESLFDQAADETLDDFLAPIQKAAKAALTVGAERAIAEIRLGLELSFSLKNPRAVAYLKAHGAELVAGVNETTKAEIRTLLARATDRGWSYNRLAEALIDRYEEFAVGRPQEHIDSRAHLVAVTETGQAYAEGNWIVAQDLRAGGLEMEKHWSTMRDDRVSDGCRANEAQGWIPADQPHLSGHMHPLRFPGCRCDELYRRKGAKE